MNTPLTLSESLKEKKLTFTFCKIFEFSCQMQNDKRYQKIRQATLIGLVLNVLLTSGKILAGVVGKSSAMLADGVHSLSDIITDIVVLAFVGVTAKDSDQNHQYGHGKYETFATMIISFVLFVVGVGIFWDGVRALYSVFVEGETIAKPGVIALYAALISIASKEWLYRYTMKVVGKTQSEALRANAWHHRSDAFSSIGTALGIGGAIFLGEHWRVLDPLAGMAVSLFIMKMAVDVGLPSVKELLETALPPETVGEIEDIIRAHQGVRYFHRLRTRKIGMSVAIEVHVKVDKILDVEASHQIATAVEDALRKRFGAQTHVGVHIEPFYPKAV